MSVLFLGQVGFRIDYGRRSRPISIVSAFTAPAAYAANMLLSHDREKGSGIFKVVKFRWGGMIRQTDLQRVGLLFVLPGLRAYPADYTDYVHAPPAEMRMLCLWAEEYEERQRELRWRERNATYVTYDPTGSRS